MSAFRQRKAAGTTARSEQARANIMAAAGEVFAQRGFDGARVD